MRTSFLTTVALSAAMVSAGVIKKRASSGLNVVYWGQDDSEKSLGSYCAANQGIDIIVLAFLSTFGNGHTPSGSFGNECSINSTGQGSCGTLATDINTCKSNGKKVLISAGGWGQIMTSLALQMLMVLPGLYGMNGPLQVPSHHWPLARLGIRLSTAGTLMLSLILTTAASIWASLSPSLGPTLPLTQAILTTYLVLHNAHFRKPIWGLLSLARNLTTSFIQFYNNDYCSAYQLFQKDGGSFNYDSWVSYVANTPSKNAKLFIGLPASQLCLNWR